MSFSLVRAPRRSAWSPILVLALAFAATTSRPAAAQPAPASPPAASSASTASRSLHTLFTEYWDWVMRESPTYATYLGDHRYADRLGDGSAAAILRRRDEGAQFLRRAEAIDPKTLSAPDATSRAMFIEDLRRDRELEAFYGKAPIRSPGLVTAMGGPHLWLPNLGRQTHLKTVAEYEAYLKRLRAMPQHLAQLQDELRAGAAAGWTPPRATLAPVPAQIGAQVVEDPTASRFYGPFRTMPDTIAPAEQQRLAADAQRAIREQVVPAFRDLRTFYETEYLPRTRETIAAARLPGGRAYYDALLRSQTTTDLTAEQIHALGQREVARIETEMDAVMRKTGFTGTRAEFVQKLWSDPQFFAPSAEAMLARYRDIAKRVDAELPKLFRELPRMPYGVQAMPVERGATAEYYERGTADGARAGLFMANTNDLKRRATWQMPSLTLHEAVPGHHLQIARALEQEGLPQFRTQGGNSAFSEGWALYAERLGDEMGLYADPYDKYGNLAAELLRAARLVVDTGLHAYDWTREQSVDYMKAHTLESEAFIRAEVDRYIVWPGQATTYKIGELKFTELRARAKAALGERFDLRAFHNVLLDSGNVPLAVLERNVDAWIAQQRKAA